MDQTSSWIIGLMKTDYAALGFIPEPTIKTQYVANERYIIQLDERGRRVGYLLHGAIRYGKPVVISQAIIDYDKRRSRYGKMTVDRLVRRAEIRYASCIQLRCASDLEAIYFWQSVGFQIVNIVPGGEKRHRHIVKFVRPLTLPLFPELEFGSDKVLTDSIIEP
jgi:hypothetical protein